MSEATKDKLAWNDGYAKIGKWNNKDEFELSKRVRTSIQNKSLLRRISCPFYTERKELVFDTDVVVDGIAMTQVTSKSDWAVHWNEMMKNWFMFRQPAGDRSNIASTMSHSAVEAVMSESQDATWTALLDYSLKKDRTKIKIIEKCYEDWQNRTNDQRMTTESVQTCAMLGTAVTYVAPIKQSKTGKIMLVGDELKKYIADIHKSKDRNAIKKLKEDLDKKKPVYVEKENITFDDIASINISPFEIYFDAAGRGIRNELAYPGTSADWRQLISIEQFKAEFGNSTDPWVIKDNIDKVKPAYESYTMYQGVLPIYELPQGLMNNRYVELIRHYDEELDEYQIIANDVAVRNGPLQSNDKRLPFSIHKWIPIPFNMYGMGLPAVLQFLQAGDEFLLNASIDQTKVTTTPSIIAKNTVFEDIDNGMDFVGAGQKMSISGDPYKDVRFFEGGAVPMQTFKMREAIQAEAIKATGINPMAYSMPRPGEPVRNNVMTMESTQKMIKKGLTNWADGEKSKVLMVVNWFKQKYPIDIDNGSKKKILLKNKELNIDGDDYAENFAKGDTEFDLKTDYFNFEGELRVKINIDRIMQTSRGMIMQEVQQALTLLPPILMNPQMLKTPGIMPLIENYCGGLQFGEDILKEIKAAGLNEDDPETAMAQDEQMLNGTEVEGRPGEGIQHKMIHFQTIGNIIGLLADPKKTDPQKAALLSRVLQNESNHLNVDNQSKMEAIPQMIEKGMQAGQPQNPMMGPQQQGQPNPMQMIQQLMQGQGGMPQPPAAGQVPMGPGGPQPM